MTICKVCGTRFEDGKRFCPSCGEPCPTAKAAALSAPMSVCKVCGARYTGGKRFCPQCGEPVGSAPAPVEKPRYDGSYTAAAVMPMKWHFVMLVLLALGGVFNVVSGILRISGQEYAMRSMDVTMIYRQFPRMKVLDLFSGIVAIGMGGFQFVIFRRLDKLCQNGPKLLTAFYIAYLVYSILYHAAASASLGVSTIGSAAINIICTLVLLFVNRSYYGKREELFKNSIPITE